MPLFAVSLLFQSLAQNRHDQQCHSAADEGGYPTIDFLVRTDDEASGVLDRYFRAMDRMTLDSYGSFSCLRYSGADGKPRELHIDKALDVTERTAPKIPFGKPQNDVLASCEYFTAIRHEIKGEKTVSVGELKI